VAVLRFILPWFSAHFTRGLLRHLQISSSHVNPTVVDLCDLNFRNKVTGYSRVLEPNKAESPAAFRDRVPDNLALSNLAELRKVLSKSLICKSIVKSSYKYFIPDRSIRIILKLPQLPIVSVLVEFRSISIQNTSLRL